MSDDGDRTCPLCAEEMDLTDQQLKPCKCGYEICVWCWHHIIDMAEKEDSEGRCPACRTPYNKQRIVGMAADCKRMVAEVNAERKQKSQKTKIKTSTIEDRKHLSSVRVVQRNLVYIMGMPSSLADESILERKEYFGQYGKILKVSFSRQAGTTTQQASNNNTSSVYITYAREEEAVRCIQAVHNFVLEGKLLRACFGTTKYCYTWLRNMTCSNPDCLYLHDIGSQEDSFTKDEIISAYTRSRVPQIASNNLQPRAGNVLPPPADDCCNNGTISSKHVLKSASNNIATQVKGSNDTSGARSTVLPVAASWALRVSNCRSPASSMACTQSQIKQKLEILNNSSCSSSMVSSINQTSAWHDDAVATSKIPEGTHVGHTDGWSRPSEPLKSGIGRDYQTKVSDLLSESDRDAGHTLVSAWDDNITMLRIPEGRHVVLRDDRSRPTEPLRPTNGRDCLTSVLDASAEIVLDGAHKSAWDDDAVTPSKILKGRHIVHIDGRNKSSDTLDLGSGPSKSSVSDVSSQIFMDEAPTSGISISCSSSPLAPAHQNKDGGIIVSIVNTNFVNSTSPGGLDNQSSSSCPDNITPGSTAFNGYMQSLCLGLSSVNLDSHLGVDHLNMDRHQSAASEHCLAGMHGILDLGLQQYYPEHGVECLTSAPLSKASVMPYVRVSGELSNSRSELQKQVLSPAGNGMEDALVHVNDKKHRLSGVTNQPSHLSFDNYPLKISYHLTRSSQNDGDAGDKHLTVDKNSRIMGSEIDKGLLSLRDNESVFFNGHKEEMPSSSAKLERVSEYPDMSYTDKELKYLGGFDDVANIDKTSNVNMGEGSIVSDILSLDFDPWDDSWSSANNFAKLLGQKDKHDGPSKLSSSWKSHSSNQSRFSFARQEYQANPEDSSCRDIGHAQNLFSSTQESYGNRFENTFSMNGFEGASAYVTSGSVISSDRTDGVSRAKISAPPGFSVPNRAPPPGFSSQDRYDQAYDACSESNLLGSSLQNQFQVYTAGNAGDVEFIDPAILAVGKRRLPLGVNNTGLGLRSFPSQYGTSESDTRIQLLMQQSIANQDPRISNHIGDRFLHLNDAYISSRFSVQNHSSISPFAQISCQQPSSILNNQWDGWNDVPIGNGMGFADILRNERFGLNNYFPVNEEPKFHISSSGDQYNRAFGM